MYGYECPCLIRLTSRRQTEGDSMSKGSIGVQRARWHIKLFITPPLDCERGVQYKDMPVTRAVDRQTQNVFDRLLEVDGVSAVDIVEQSELKLDLHHAAIQETVEKAAVEVAKSLMGADEIDVYESPLERLGVIVRTDDPSRDR